MDNLEHSGDSGGKGSMNMRLEMTFNMVAISVLLAVVTEHLKCG